MSSRTAPDIAYTPRQKARIAVVPEPRCGDAPNTVVWKTRWDDTGTEGCGRMLARLISAPAHIDCPRCKRPNVWGSRDSEATDSNRQPGA